MASRQPAVAGLDIALSTGNISSDRFLWPPWCTIAFYDLSGTCLMRTHDRALDLSDTMSFYDDTILLGISTRSKKWTRWNMSNLDRLERLIRYDLGFDGCRVRLRRKTKAGGRCTVEFRWRLTAS